MFLKLWISLNNISRYLIECGTVVHKHQQNDSNYLAEVVTLNLLKVTFPQSFFLSSSVTFPLTPALKKSKDGGKLNNLCRKKRTLERLSALKCCWGESVGGWKEMDEFGARFVVVWAGFWTFESIFSCLLHLALRFWNHTCKYLMMLVLRLFSKYLELNLIIVIIIGNMSIWMAA